jgi:aromatic acid exporter family member 1
MPLPGHGTLRRTVLAAQARRRALGRALRRPGRERDTLLQIVKSAAAAVVAWRVAVILLDSAQPFLAPLAALITVHATVYRSLRGAAQPVAAVLAGVLLAFLATRTLGVSAVSLGVVLVVAMVIARWHRLGDEGLQVPITALLAMTIAGGVRDTALQARFVETMVGAVIGAGTNLLVLPPVYLRSARAAVAESAAGVSRLLRSIAEGLHGDWGRDDAQDWLERARRLDRSVRSTRVVIDQGQESLRFNPRRREHPRSDSPAALQRAVDALEHIGIQCRSIATTLLDAAQDENRPRPTRVFLRYYAETLHHTADAFDALAGDAPDSDEADAVRAGVRRGGDRWRDLRGQIEAGRVHAAAALPSYGSLLVDAERILDELERAESCLVVSTP